MDKEKKIFISYSSDDEFEAEMLQFVLETSFSDMGVLAWTFQRDQKCSEKEIANKIRMQIEQSIAMVFLISPSTIESGATQWMELAYADAFKIETYVLLNHIDYDDLKSKEHDIPPLLMSSQCNPAIKWRKVINEIAQFINNGGKS